VLGAMIRGIGRGLRRVRRHAVLRALAPRDAASVLGARLRAPRQRDPRHARLVGGLWADKFDQLAAFQNFLITPLTFLSGVFYSIHSLPPFWQALSHANPFFYMIDGFRYGFFGLSDAPPR
jgi:hypothetical protein